MTDNRYIRSYAADCHACAASRILIPDVQGFVWITPDTQENFLIQLSVDHPVNGLIIGGGVPCQRIWITVKQDLVAPPQSFPTGCIGMTALKAFKVTASKGAVNYFEAYNDPSTGWVGWQLY